MTERTYLAELTLDQLRRLRTTAAQQKRVCLPLDRDGWQRTYQEVTEELERCGQTCFPESGRTR